MKSARSRRDDMGAFGTDFTSPFVPVGVTPRYPPPRAHIDPDRSASWLRRVMPIVKAHRGIFLLSLVASFVGLAVQVQIPKEVGLAIDQGLRKQVSSHGSSLEHFVVIIVVLAMVRLVLTYISRLYLLKTAYRMEYDLRNIMYEHLSRMSFSFYDRVQSGQLISRANSDIRSVQMYLAFAPSILVQCGVVVWAFAFMLSINVPLAFVAMSTMPFVFIVAVQMRKQMFPGVVAHPGPAGRGRHGGRRERQRRAGGEVVRRRGQPAQAADRHRQAGRVGQREGRRHPGDWSPLIENLPRLGQALVLFYGGYLAIHGQASIGDIVAFNAYVLMLQPPFRQLGMILMMGQRASASAQRIYEVLDEQPDIVDRPGAVDLVECRGDVHFDDVTFVVPERHAGARALRPAPPAR